jgi:hypothetical protein
MLATRERIDGHSLLLLTRLAEQSPSSGEDSSPG